MKKLTFILLAATVLLFSTGAKCQTTYNFYYGTLHSHTGYSDGSKDSLVSGISNPYQAYNYAKASTNFDFLGISEHNHSSAGMYKSNYHRGVQQADSANEDGEFVALFGMEWGTISSGGHVLVFGIDSLINWEIGNYDIFVGKGVYPQLWDKINKRPGAFGMAAHPNETDFYNIKNGIFNSQANAALVGSAFRSGPAFSTNISYSNQSNSNFEDYYIALLKKGYHVGPTYDHDNHYTTFGRTTEGRLVAIAPALTRADLMHAFRNRAFYASDDWNAEVLFTENTNHPMGSIVTSDAVPSFFATLSDGDGESYTEFKIIKGRPRDPQNPVVVASVSAPAMALSFSDADLVLGDSAYYYVSITQADGDRIITSPIWYNRGDLISSAPSNNQNLEIRVWPNPVTSSANGITFATDKPGVVIVTDVLGIQIKKYEVAKGSTLLDLPALPTGLYGIQFYFEGALAQTLKLVVK